MPCGEARDVHVHYWTTCWQSFSYPCGIRWCKKWGIPYPCGVKFCRGRFPYPCRKTRIETRYCYDFSVAKGSCKVFYESWYGCCGGQEYSWSDGCLGWFTHYESNYSRCFEEPLKPEGPCKEGNSLPPGGQVPGGPLDEGSVAPHLRDPNYLKRIVNIIGKRLGICGRCMRWSGALCVAAWISLALATVFDAPSMLVSRLLWGIALPTTVLSAAHVARFVYGQHVLPRKVP